MLLGGILLIQTRDKKVLAVQAQFVAIQAQLFLEVAILTKLSNNHKSTWIKFFCLHIYGLMSFMVSKYLTCQTNLMED